MIGTIGDILINAALVSAILAAVGYFIYARRDENRLYRISNWLFGVKFLLVLAASGLLLYLILAHRFDYYYVFNYTSRNLQLRYLVSAFWGGQEGSFMLWILFSALIGFGLIRWTKKPYRGPVLFLLTLTQVFLLSMVAGITIGDFTLGASPFRTLAQEMPDAPFLQANPDFIPSDGKGLNDLLKSPWMMIHPPILFLGFSMMTVPYCFAMAALWKRKYNDWVRPALPWTLGANVALLTAIFLGGYWAYVTLSFGGYWAWDPVENASFVPWLLGTAGIHTMVIQKKSSTSQKASIIFAILAYVAVVYETFLTRSGILADASVHSFVDLGLYNQLLAFMFVVVAIGIGMLVYRYKELPAQQRESKFLSREFMTFAGAMVLFLVGLVITIGTSSPIIGRLFVESPTPPEVSFYNEWTMPLAILAAIMTVIGQHLFWKRQDAESLARDLTWPVIITCVVSLATIVFGEIRNLYYMVFVLAGWFALFGNAFVMFRLAKKNPRLIGGSLSHTGFGILLLGILASSVYNQTLLDQEMRNYNAAIEQGEVVDEEGFPVLQKVEFLELKLNQPKIINNEYRVTYEGYTLENQERPGQQQYRVKFEPADGEGQQFYLYPEVYPMLSASSGNGPVQWSVDPDVRVGLLSDIYLYVSGSSYVEQKNEELEQRRNMQPAAASQGGREDTTDAVTLNLDRGGSSTIGSYQFRFIDYGEADPSRLPDSTAIAVKAQLEMINKATGRSDTLNPLFAIYTKDGSNWTYAPPVEIPGRDASVQFTKVDPTNGKVELKVRGIEGDLQDEWVLIVAEEKPFISLVWMGTFVLMAGFTVSIYRHWSRGPNRS